MSVNCHSEIVTEKQAKGADRQQAALRAVAFVPVTAPSLVQSLGRRRSGCIDDGTSPSR